MAAVQATTEQASQPTVGTRFGGSGWLALLAVYIFWGSAYRAIRLGDRTFPPLLLTGTFYVTSAVILYPFVRGLAKSTDRSVSWLHWRSAAITGGLMLLGANGLLSVAEVTLPAGIAAVAAASVVLWLVPIVATVAGFLLLNEALTEQTVLAMVVTLAGVALILLTRRSPAA